MTAPSTLRRGVPQRTADRCLALWRGDGRSVALIAGEAGVPPDVVAGAIDAALRLDGSSMRAVAAARDAIANWGRPSLPPVPSHLPAGLRARLQIARQVARLFGTAPRIPVTVAVGATRWAA